MSAACNIYDDGGAGGGCSAAAAAAGAGGVRGEFSATECVDCCRRRWLPTSGASHREMMRSVVEPVARGTGVKGSVCVCVWGRGGAALCKD